MQAAIRASQIFKSLGNTASAWYFGLKAAAYPADCDPEHPLLRVLTKEVDPNMERWRHPDPRLVALQQLMTNPDKKIPKKALVLDLIY